MLTISRIYRLVFMALFATLLGKTAQSAPCVPNVAPGYPSNVTELKGCIVAANSSSINYVIDLGGATFTLTTVDNTTIDGDNGLPGINNTAHQITFQNGTIERSLLFGTPQFRIMH